MDDTDTVSTPDFDVVVAGAGMAGLYQLHKLRALGFSVRVFETGDDVGGTWYWNRYPGARCDIQSIDYSYSWDPELQAEWEWSERYATQPEILRYLQHVADKHDLRRDIQFSTRIDSARWDDSASLWRLNTSDGTTVSARYYVMATGCLSLPKAPDVTGADRFAGEVYFTSRWPHEGVDFTGKRVAVIGTGSSAIQSIPIIASQASQLTVFQRTPNFSIPARNGPLPEARRADYEADPAGYRERARWSRAGVPMGDPPMVSALAASEEERQESFESFWEASELLLVGAGFSDTLSNAEANEMVGEFVRNKIRSIVNDPETAEALCPTTHYIGTKRTCLDTNYYQTYNQPHVRLVDLRKTPIDTVTETGIDTSAESLEFDVIVMATGFDAMTGAIVSVDITGRDGSTLKEKWAAGPETYLGLMTTGFPNFFMITGPGSPSVLSNMAVSIEQHVEWISDCLEELRRRGFDTIEPTETAEAGWVKHNNEFADLTLMPSANSWYMGANVPGKPRVFLPYVGGVDTYRTICNEVVERDYLGFVLSGSDGSHVNDGVVRQLKPDVGMMMQIMASLGLPPIESLSPDDARAFMAAAGAANPPGPEVGEVVDGVLHGSTGDLPYRLYRPPTGGAHPIVAYFHGGGWVLGNLDSDDAMCRDLCVKSDAIIVSVNYRHAPEDRFPAAADDGFAAIEWIAAHAEELGGIPDRLAVCGWSAGANVAAVAAQSARDAGGPALAGQVLLTPVTDSDQTRDSYVRNGDGFVLTAALMKWFWDHYADEADRTDPKAAPIRAADLSGLPPTLILTCEFDPLADEGAAYAAALAEAGVETRHIMCEGLAHTSVPAVGVLVSGDFARDEMGAALREMLGMKVSV